MKLETLKKQVIVRKMSGNYLNFKLIFFIFFIFFICFKNVFSKENYIVTTVNKLPITKLDILNRSKLIAYSINNDFTLKNLDNYYNQALRTLINEKIIFSAGKKIIALAFSLFFLLLSLLGLEKPKK